MSESQEWYENLCLESKVDADIRVHECIVDGATEEEAIKIVFDNIHSNGGNA